MFHIWLPDRKPQLSALPDVLLHEILSCPSCHPHRSCKRACCRGGGGLWRSTPYDHIDERHFWIDVNDHGSLEKRWGKFEDFTTNLLLFHDTTSSLDEFRFSSRLYNQYHVDRWIHRGIDYCPAVLQIEILDSCDISDFELTPVAGSSFRRLKKLTLCNLYLNNHFADLLCSACPVLEDLKLSVCWFCHNYSQGITSSTLNKLVVERCFNDSSHPLVITSPSLAYLRLIEGTYEAGILLHNMHSLVEAEIYIRQFKTLPQENVRGLLGSLFNVTNLYLCGFEAEMILNENSDKFLIFRNVRTLYLHRCFLNDYELNDKLEAFWSFIQNTPCLEKHTLRQCMYYSFSDTTWEEERKNITLNCLHRQDRKTVQCHKLNLIEVMYDYDHDHQLIELLWNLGRNLPNACIKLSKIDHVWA